MGEAVVGSLGDHNFRIDWLVVVYRLIRSPKGYLRECALNTLVCVRRFQFNYNYR